LERNSKIELQKLFYHQEKDSGCLRGKWRASHTHADVGLFRFIWSYSWGKT